MTSSSRALRDRRARARRRRATRTWTVVAPPSPSASRVPRTRAPWRAAARRVAASPRSSLAALSPPGRAVIDSLREAIGVEQRRSRRSSRCRRRAGCSSARPRRRPGSSGRTARSGCSATYREASWSPFGRFVVAAREQRARRARARTGGVRWTLARPGRRARRAGAAPRRTRGSPTSRDAPPRRRRRRHRRPPSSRTPPRRAGLAAGRRARAGLRDAERACPRRRRRLGRRPRRLGRGAEAARVLRGRRPDRGARDKRLDVYREHALRTWLPCKPCRTRSLRFLDAAWAPAARARVRPLRPGDRPDHGLDRRPRRPRQDAAALLRRGADLRPRVVARRQVADGRLGRRRPVDLRPRRQGPTKVVSRSSITEQLNGSFGRALPGVAGWCCTAR